MGCTLGKFLSEGGFQLSGYTSRSPESAEAAAEFTGSKHYSDISDLIKESDAVFITVPDGKIRSVYEEVSKNNIGGKIICHASGSLTAAECFPHIEDKGAYGYSIHPLFPVSTKFETYKELEGAFFCIEGSKRYLEKIKDEADRLGCHGYIIDGSDKVKYHAACAISSNLMCSLIGESLTLLKECGFTEELALQALSPLIKSNMNHVLEVGPKDALTGPVERCDTGTVEKHLACFNTEKERNLYRWASLKVVELAEERHAETDYSGLKKLLLEDTADRI